MNIRIELFFEHILPSVYYDRSNISAIHTVMSKDKWYTK